MKKIISILILLQIFCAVMFSSEIKVTVMDAEIEIPLEDVTISVSQISENWLTDDLGDTTISIPDEVFKENGDSLTLSAYLPGYAIKKIRINSSTTEVSINLSIEDILEGKELIVEQKAYEKTDAVTGISVVITKDQFDNASQIGSIPDVMTAVKTLPGVTYMGSFSQQPSIRGAYPYEMACMMDGTFIYSPFHWNGGVSIFDPMFIKSVKLSHGIFSARNGHATAGLLDITTVEPEDETIKFNASVSDIITDGIFQIPFNKQSGLVAGYRVSYYDTIPWLYDHLGLTKFIMKEATEGNEEFSDFQLTDYITMPNMQDFYGKFYFNPSDRLHISVTEFLGMEGIGFHLLEEEELFAQPEYDWDKYEKYYDYTKFGTDLIWKNIFSFGSLSVQLLPTDKLQFNLQGNYNQYNSTRYINNFTDSISDTVRLSEEYLDEAFEFEDFYWGNPDYNDYITTRKYYYYHMNKNTLNFEDSYEASLLQGKGGASYAFGENQIISAGFEEFYKTKSSKNELKYSDATFSKYHYDNEPEEAWGSEEPNEFSLPIYSVNGNRILNSIAYTTYEFGDTNSKFQGEAGFRFEHYYIYNKVQGSKHKVKIGTIPTFNPRISARYKPEIKNDFFQDLTFSAGTGLFSNISDSLININSEYKIEGNKLKPDQDWFTIAGTQFNFLDNFTFQIEGYYKWYLSRFYSVGAMSTKNIFSRLMDYIYDDDPRNYINKAFSDGTGHVFGFDAMLQKKNGRYFDGYLTYSFIFAKYLNPFSPEENKTVERKIRTDAEDPLGEWYYPYFHRFHTFSAVLNMRPKNGLVITLTGSIVSGVPIDKDNPLNEIFYYEDDKTPSRTTVSFPINFRIGWSNYRNASKLQYEWYFGVENLLGFLNRNSLIGALVYMNNHQDDTDNLLVYSDRISNFDVGLPVLSLGLRISM